MSINIIRLYHLAGMILILISFGFTLNSCEQDELPPTKPITSTCDTNNVTYDLVIKPILDKNCTSCHNDDFSGGRVNLSNYTNAQITAVSGKLISGLSGSMKSYINDECEIVKIKAWVNQGSKE